MKSYSATCLAITAFLAFAQRDSAPAGATGLSPAEPNSRSFAKSALTMARFDSVCGWDYCPPFSPETRGPLGQDVASQYEDRRPVRRNSYEHSRPRYDATFDARRRFDRDWDRDPERRGSYKDYGDFTAGAHTSHRSSFVDEASRRYRIPTSWIRAVMQAESGGDVASTSSKGAMGLMQIMPETWASLSPRCGLGDDPYDPHDNIMAGAAYIREMHDRFGSPGFLAAYNAGPDRYEDYLASGRPLPRETQAYVAAIAPKIGERSSNPQMSLYWYRK